MNTQKTSVLSIESWNPDLDDLIDHIGGKRYKMYGTDLSLSGVSMRVAHLLASDIADAMAELEALNLKVRRIFVSKESGRFLITVVSGIGRKKKEKFLSVKMCSICKMPADIDKPNRHYSTCKRGIVQKIMES